MLVTAALPGSQAKSLRKLVILSHLVKNIDEALDNINI
jgi:hypothetical protein